MKLKIVHSGIIGFGLFAMLALVLFTRASAGQADITLKPDQTFQTMTGWEATAALTMNPSQPVWAPYYARMLDQVANDVGINRIRLEVRAGAENPTGQLRRFMTGQTSFEAWKDLRYDAVNDNDDPFVINPDGFDFSELDWHIEQTVVPLAERLQARGERLSINLCYVAFRNGQYFQIEPEEYAELILATYLHMRDSYGLVPDMLEVILEPDHSSNAWDGKDIGRAIVATAKRLQDNGFKPAFVVPSVTNMDNAVPYMNAIAGVPGAIEHVVEFSYHRYKGATAANLRAIATHAHRHGIPSGMLELWFGKATYQVLMQDITLGLAGAFQGRALTGLLVVPKGANPKLTLQDEVRYNAQFFRHIRLGAVRIGADSTSRQAFDPVAFVNADGRMTVVMVADGAGSVTVRGLRPGSYGISYAIGSGSDTLPDAAVAAAGDALTIEMPGTGVLTIAGQ